MVAANQVPRVIDTISAERPKEQSTLTEPEQQVLLLYKLDLSGLDAWPKEQAEEAQSPTGVPQYLLFREARHGSH